MKMMCDIIEQKQLCSYLQPIVSMRSKSIVGFEALARLVDPVLHTIDLPEQLFETARNENAVLELDRLCRHAALSAFAPLYYADRSLMLFLNFESSIIDLGAAGSGYLSRTVAEFGISPENIVIEIVESEVRDIESLERFISAHRAAGFVIALDDVGAGHSNLNRVSIVRPDIIKIDRSLISGIDNEYYKRKVFEALCTLAQSIGTLVLAEGVESAGEVFTTYELGADLYQGYYFSKPQPPLADCFSCISLVASMAEKCRKKTTGIIAERHLSSKYYRSAMKEIVSQLCVTPSENFDDVLLRNLPDVAECECLYLLDINGPPGR